MRCTHFFESRSDNFKRSADGKGKINSISRRIYANAAGAIAGMVSQELPQAGETRPLITASMFGNTTACVNAADTGAGSRWLRGAGLPRHGSRRQGDGIADRERHGRGLVLDITTTEWADHVCGGVLSAGPDRMMAAARAGIPTVLVPGCVDMCNFWGIDTVPEKYRQRNLYKWNPNVTLMRTTRRGKRRAWAR